MQCAALAWISEKHMKDDDSRGSNSSINNPSTIHLMTKVRHKGKHVKHKSVQMNHGISGRVICGANVDNG